MSTNLKLHVTLHDQHVHRSQLIDKSVPFKLLSYFRPDLRNGHVQRVHLLDLRSLRLIHVSLSIFCCEGALVRLASSLGSILELVPSHVTSWQLGRMLVLARIVVATAGCRAYMSLLSSLDRLD